jgi:hypothetical protein
MCGTIVASYTQSQTLVRRGQVQFGRIAREWQAGRANLHATLAWFFSSRPATHTNTHTHTHTHTQTHTHTHAHKVKSRATNISHRMAKVFTCVEKGRSALSASDFFHMQRSIAPNPEPNMPHSWGTSRARGTSTFMSGGLGTPPASASFAAPTVFTKREQLTWSVTRGSPRTWGSSHVLGIASAILQLACSKAARQIRVMSNTCGKIQRSQSESSMSNLHQQL